MTEAETQENNEATALVGTLVADRYQIEALLGAGAMGAVYRARHVHMQKAFALKVLHRETSARPEIVSRFEREAIAAGRIAHPNVAGATDFGRLADGSFYLVLEYVAGKSLAKLIAEESPLPLTRSLSIIEQIVSALAAAHRADIVHRDLKPDNVMLLDAGVMSQATAVGLDPTRSTIADGDVVKVLDFGLAKLERQDADATQLTMAGAVYGTPQYMSPEQAAGQEVDARADLYAVGLMLYEMLAGKPPFVSEQLMPLLIKHMTEEPPPLPAEVPRALRKIVMKLLEKKPEDRYQTADELFEALRAFNQSQNATEARRSMMGSVAALPIVPQVVDKVGELSTSARRASRPLLDYLRRELTRTLRIGGHTVPRWVPGLGIALCLGAFVTVWVVRGEAPGGAVRAAAADSTEASDLDDEDAPPRRVPSKLDPALQKVVEAAKAGSETAIYALEQRPASERSVDEWLALSQAYLMRKKVDEALDAFAAAIKGDELAREDKALLGALRFLADDEKHAETILSFVAKHLGPVAPDFLFDVWSKTSAKTLSTTKAFELLSTRSVRKQASPALDVALQLREIDQCADYAKLLPRIEEVGDERVLTRLRDLRKTRGCGQGGREDCYPCLREGKALDSAYTQAAMRKAPRFPLLRRWRWR